MNFPSQIFFNDINYGCRAAILKKMICGCFFFIWLWLLISIIKRYIERCALQLYQLYQTSLRQNILIHRKSFVTIKTIQETLPIQTAVLKGGGGGGGARGDIQNFREVGRNLYGATWRLIGGLDNPLETMLYYLTHISL